MRQTILISLIISALISWTSSGVLAKSSAQLKAEGETNELKGAGKVQEGQSRQVQADGLRIQGKHNKAEKIQAKGIQQEKQGIKQELKGQQQETKGLEKQIKY